MSISQTNLARKLGISQKTVSRALTGKGYVKEDLKAKIISTANKHGYRRNNLARALIDGKTRIIGIHVHPLGGDNYHCLLSHLEHEIAANGYQVMVTHAKPETVNSLQGISTLLGFHVEGVITISETLTLPRQQQYNELISHGEKIVSIFQESFTPAMGAVLNSDYKSTRKCVQHLISMGHKHIAYIDDFEKDIWSYTGATLINQRQQGYMDAMAANNLPCCHAPLFSRKNQELTEKTAHFLSLNPQVTAFCCLNDETALSLINALKMLDFSVPEHYSVTGIGDSLSPTLQSLLSPRLTTIRIKYHEIAKQATTLLFAMINGGGATTHEVSGSFISRESVRAI